MIEELSRICKVETDVDLTKYNTYRLNSFCYALVHVDSIEKLVSVISKLKEYKTKWFVLGNGSNVILPEYYDGVIIKLDLNKYIIKSDEIYVEAGCMINKIAMMLAENGYAGLDFACGIPGTIGGSIYGNAGSYGSSISEVLISAIVLDGKKIVEYTNEELKFQYRSSILKEKHKLIVLSARFKIHKTDKEELLSIISERAEKRAASQDLSHPSCGSVFRNPEGMAAGKLIDDLGLKGYSIGGAMVSNIHANFIINNGNATSKDIIKLIRKIKRDVKKAYGIDLVLEQEIVK